jgi:tripartite-type tricarboxylate transporter receptor subunit TctC
MDKNMKTTGFDRRALLLAAAGTALGGEVLAQPANSPKVVRMLVGFPPGQATDMVARMMSEKLQAATGESFVVDNKPGQGGSLALGALAKSAPDGSTVMLAHMSALATNPHMYRKVPYDSLKDFAPVGLVGDLPFVLVCNSTLPFQNVKELIAYAKVNPDKLTNASSGNGTVSHLAMEEFKRQAGIKITHVPYKGSAPGLTDVMSGNVSLALETAAAVRPHVESGRLRALAAGSSKRLTGVLAVPTLTEQGFPITASTWLMVLYPAGTPKAMIQSTFKAIETLSRSEDFQQQLLTIGALPRFSKSPEEASAYLKSEYSTWGEIVKRSGTTLD